MAVTVLRPEKVKGGVRFAIALTNTSDIPIIVDTGGLGPHARVSTTRRCR